MTRVLVSAIPARTPFITYLKRHIQDLEVVWDTTQNAMDTFLTTMRNAGNDPIVHLEDDILLTKNFMAKIEQAISERPHEVIQFFSRSGADIAEGSRYRSGGSYLMNQCQYLPTGIARGISEYYPLWGGKEKHPTGCDSMMGDYFRVNKMRYWNHVPSLVNHALVKSQIDSRRSRFRQAKVFIEPEMEGYPLENLYD